MRTWPLRVLARITPADTTALRPRRMRSRSSSLAPTTTGPCFLKQNGPSQILDFAATEDVQPASQLGANQDRALRGRRPETRALKSQEKVS